MPPRHEDVFETASIGHFVNISDIRIGNDALDDSIGITLQIASEELRNLSNSTRIALQKFASEELHNYEIFIAEPEETSKEVIEEWNTLIE